MKAPSFFISLVLLLTGVTAGFILGKRGAGAPAEVPVARPTLAGEEVRVAAAPGIAAPSPYGALGEILSYPDLALRDRVLRDRLASLPLVDFPAFFSDLARWMGVRESMGDPDVYTTVSAAYETVADVLVERDPEGGLDALLGAFGTPDAPLVLDGLVGIVFRKMASKDFGAALAYFERNRDAIGRVHETLKEDLTGDLLKHWAKTDPGAAAGWAAALPDDERPAATGYLLKVLMLSDPARAAAVFDRSPDLPQRALAAEHLAYHRAAVDPEGALGWAGGLEGELGRNAVNVAFQRWMDEDPGAAGQGFRSLEGGARDVAVRVMSHQFYQRGEADFQGAARFLGEQPGGEGRNEAAADLIANWAYVDLDAATAWLAGQPAGGWRDPAVAEIARAWRMQNPAAGADWLAVIEDPSTRRDLLGSALEEWIATDPAGAIGWMTSGGTLAEDDRTLLLERFQIGGAG